MPARPDRSSVPCVDPLRPHHRPDTSAGADAILAFRVSCDAGRVGRILASDAEAGLARSARSDQAWRSRAGRRPAPVHGSSAIFQGPAGAAAASGRSGGLMNGHIEPMVGRYVHVEIDGTMHRIYFEENGAGIPLVCLHTAGSDGRQWRHLLADEEFANNFRIIAFDMPWHGKSNPPANWSGEEYQLTTARYTETVRAFCKALKPEKPDVSGCSIGGRIVLNLAIDHAAEFRALIGLEAADFQAPWYDTTWLNRPDVHGGEVCAALVSGLIAPQSPDVTRTETLWGYKQGGPGVFKGDLYFYRVDGDLRGRVEAIHPKVRPLYLLTGEYDFSCTPEDTKRTD